MKWILGVLLLLMTFSCEEVEPKKKYAKKTAIGEMNRVHGMVTYTVYLYGDGTYYVPSTKLIKYAEGKYKIKGDIIQFWNTGGSEILNSKYKITGNEASSLSPEIDILYITWYD